eukprot:TRINITY_DN7835_c0_g1_i3.p1 TRINITY_DN7835_c0_g1~~TRINITY_DN7835_c0_g1_i3.p1  ORF type:complete len:718 (-),score=248.14 TRINITY_DN7835_c0_g1_i3:137-2290(-)
MQQTAKDMSSLQEEVNKLIAERQELLSRLSSVNASEVLSNELRSQLAESQQFNVELRKEKSDMERKVDELKGCVKDLENKLLQRAEEAQAFKELQEETAALHRKIYELQEQRELLSAQHQEEVKRAKNSEDNEQRKVFTQNAELSGDVVKLQEKITELESEKEQLKSMAKKGVSEARAEFEEKIKQQQDEIARMHLINSELEAEKRLLSERQELKCAQSAEELLKQEIAGLNQSIAKLKEECELNRNLNNERSSIEIRVKELETVIEKLRGEIVELESERLNAEKRHEDEMNDVLNSSDVYVKEIKAGFETVIEELKEEATKLKNQVADLESENGKLKDKSKEALSEPRNSESVYSQEEMQILKERVNSLEQEKQAMSENFEIEVNAIVSKATDDAVKSLQSQITALENERNQLQSKCNELNKQKPYGDNSDYIRSLELKLYEYQNIRKDNLYSMLPAELSPKHTSEVVMLKQNLKDIEVKFYEYDTLTRNFSKNDHGLTQELDQMSRKTKRLLQTTEETVRVFEHELASFEAEKERYNEEVSSLDRAKKCSSQEANKLQEQVRVLDLKLYSAEVDREDYRRKYVAKIDELKRVKTMAERLKGDFERYKQRKQETGARLALKIQEDAIKNSLEIETLRRKLEEKSAELEKVSRPLGEKQYKNAIVKGEERVLGEEMAKEKCEQSLAKEELAANLSEGKTNTSQVGLKGAKGDTSEDF